MVVAESLSHTFPYEWEDVSLASWKKYPNPERPDVLSVDIIDRKFDPATGQLTARRVVIMKDRRLPRILQPIFGGGYCICVEDSVVDPVNKKMVLQARNVTFQNIASIEETCTYTVSAHSAAHTNLVQEAKVTAFPFGVKGTIEKFLGDKFKSNAVAGRKIMDKAIERVMDEYKEAYDKFRTETGDYLKNIRSETGELCDKIVHGTEDRLDKFKQEADDVVSTVLEKAAHIADTPHIYHRE
mmetsp:Transcript_174/g.597  ORF Transcript_174/g.597 Transcript_174/m.597 type:complete len:241 (-) Transcript_174:60-782(-)|eukprot:CAMPEP_0114617040 /NCGR_PEP_ID=MMETSP0168-20121206/6993_1 /TAXON_ID=95228 ORGANISM="Vannella sp., Strain DIVA3 517/6/12" /NCGR_SAMPLE_ID=MMETSP0168 /ASSEMBLY_ACC=CAM_ASM_000044 /LENGTH=240 /DNA_ID=CAMNT_0001828165 /DNA_START=201 /DNA_END=923 /DNA_ORIENTATION=-